jgi:hypothetical protein
VCVALAVALNVAVFLTAPSASAADVASACYAQSRNSRVKVNGKWNIKSTIDTRCVGDARPSQIIISATMRQGGKQIGVLPERSKLGARNWTRNLYSRCIADKCMVETALLEWSVSFFFPTGTIGFVTTGGCHASGEWVNCHGVDEFWIDWTGKFKYSPV